MKKKNSTFKFKNILNNSTYELPWQWTKGSIILSSKKI